MAHYIVLGMPRQPSRPGRSEGVLEGEALLERP